ncbi:MAG TPA: heme-binding domain-containing protein [Thermoanaerobaculia bacterium]|nr:heme-binding domain-containing protein [Thermoanaerobaculia bacterium]
MKKTTIVLAGLVIALAGAQFVRPARTNPAVDAPLAIGDPAVEAVLRRACFDCHSNETRWPWYSAVAPSSWLVVRDVNEGRGEMNFSSWNDPEGELREEICEKVREGEMPLKIYLPLHAKARLTEADKTALCAWANRAPSPQAGTHTEDDA